MEQPRPYRLFCCFLFAALLTINMAEKEKAASLQALATVPALPLIQVLLEQMPPKPRGLWKKQVNSQHLNYMLDLYRKSADRDGRPKVNRTVDSNTVRLVKPFSVTEQHLQDPWLIQTLQFNLEAFPVAEQLTRAAVVYFHTRSLVGSWFSCKVELPMEGRVTSEHPNHSNKPNFTQGSTDDTNKHFTKWAELDITSYLQSLTWEPSKNTTQILHLHYLCILSEKLEKPLPWQKMKSITSHHLPFILLYLNTHKSSTTIKNLVMNVPYLDEKTKSSIVSTHSRRARQTGNIGLKLPSYRQKNSISKNQCTLHTFRVSFHQLGWDHWIIAPHRYNPKYCKGDCPRVLRYGYNSPNHAIVQNFINELVDQSVPRPSCVPYKYSPISVLMIEANGSILYKEYENMIAESCTCR